MRSKWRRVRCRERESVSVQHKKQDGNLRHGGEEVAEAGSGQRGGGGDDGEVQDG